MPTFNNIKQLLGENDFEAAFKALEQKNLNINQKDDVLRFKYRFSDLEDKVIRQLITQEKASVIRNNILNDLLDFFYKIENGKYEIEAKPKKSLTEKLFGFISFQQQSADVKTNLFAEEETKIIENLIERYESRLEQKTDKRLPVDLELTYTREGTSDDYFQRHFDKVEINQPINTDWVTTLKKHEHILIIGKPGAGKSTQLLELAVAWLKDKTCPQITVVFNLAPWTFDNQHFHEWLQSALVSGYGFSKALAKEAIEKNRILPLLDGLDEVGAKEETDDKKDELRSHCLDAIDRYLALSDVPYMAICSRINEFKTATDAPIKAEILINPLTPKQIRQTFINALKDKQNLTNNDENAVNNLLQLLKIHPTLEKILCTPFYYNIALDVFGEYKTKKYKYLPNKQDDLEQYLVEAFLDKKLINTKNKHGYEAKKIRHYLGFVASVLEMKNLKNFELVDINWISPILKGMLLGTTFSIILPFNIYFNLIVGFLFGFLGSFSTLTLTGIILGLHTVEIDFNNDGLWIIIQDIIGLIVSTLLIIYPLTYLGMLLDYFNGSFLNNKKDYTFINLKNLIYLIFGDLYNLIGYSILIIYLYWKESEVQTIFYVVCVMLTIQTFLLIFTNYKKIDKSKLIKVRNIVIPQTPYFRIIDRFPFEIIFNFSLLSIIIFTFNFLVKHFEILLFGFITFEVTLSQVIILIISTSIILSFFSNHFLSRLKLFFLKKLPFRWVSFFTYATKASILEQDGGQWRFRHQILQDYFLEHWKKNN
ncbi:MAG: NACHT domain-containing protein [Saprospiraceae bacterium]